MESNPAFQQESETAPPRSSSILNAGDTLIPTLSPRPPEEINDENNSSTMEIPEIKSCQPCAVVVDDYSDAALSKNEQPDVSENSMTKVRDKTKVEHSKFSDFDLSKDSNENISLGVNNGLKVLDLSLIPAKVRMIILLLVFTLGSYLYQAFSSRDLYVFTF